MRSFVFSLAVAVVVTGCGPLNPMFAGGPYRGKVIDAETKKPIAGAVVLVYWQRLAPGIGHGPAEGFLDAEEVLTDSNGEFVVGKNPPASLIPGTWVSRAYVTIFQPGYGYFPLYQVSPAPSLGLDKLNQALEQYAVIELPKLRTREERLKVIDRLGLTGVPDEKKPNLRRLRELEYSRLLPAATR